MTEGPGLFRGVSLTIPVEMPLSFHMGFVVYAELGEAFGNSSVLAWLEGSGRRSPSVEQALKLCRQAAVTGRTPFEFEITSYGLASWATVEALGRSSNTA